MRPRLQSLVTTKSFGKEHEMETPSVAVEVKHAESENGTESGLFVRQVEDQSLQAQQVLIQQLQSGGPERLSPVYVP